MDIWMAWTESHEFGIELSWTLGKTKGDYTSDVYYVQHACLKGGKGRGVQLQTFKVDQIKTSLDQITTNQGRGRRK